MLSNIIYIDTEFSEGFFKPISWLPSWLPFNKPRWSIEMISIGLVKSSGETYYAINKNFKLSRCNEWVRKNVISKLPSKYLIEEIEQDDPDTGFGHGKLVLNPLYKTTEEIKADIIKFAGIHPVFKAYYADYDWVVFCTMFGTMMDLPEGFPMYCRDLKKSLDERVSFMETWYDKTGVPDIFQSKLDRIKKHQDYPKQHEDDEHTALSDAQWNKRLDEFMHKHFPFM
jgi:hypothetical protein